MANSSAIMATTKAATAVPIWSAVGTGGQLQFPRTATQVCWASDMLRPRHSLNVMQYAMTIFFGSSDKLFYNQFSSPKVCSQVDRLTQPITITNFGQGAHPIGRAATTIVCLAYLATAQSLVTGEQGESDKGPHFFEFS